MIIAKGRTEDEARRNAQEPIYARSRWATLGELFVAGIIWRLRFVS
jgi:hypothetical protein